MMRGVVACYISLPHACRPFRESLPSALACRKSFPKRFGLCVLRVRLVTGGCCAGAAQRPSSSQQDRRVEGHLRKISWHFEGSWFPWIRTRRSEGESRERRAAQLTEHCCIMWLCLNPSGVCDLFSLRASRGCLNGHPSAPKVISRCEASRSFLKRTARD